MNYSQLVECRVFRDFIHNQIVVLAWEGIGGRGRAYTMQNGNLTCQDVEPGCIMPPLLVLEGRNGKAFLQTLVNAIAEEGIVAEQIDTMRELTATKNHLADMRDMATRAFNKLLEKP